MLPSPFHLPRPHHAERDGYTLPRRAALKIGGLGLLGLSLPRLWAAEEAQQQAAAVAQAAAIKARAKSVIFLFQFGGPTHIDTFDMKPHAPEGIRGQHRPIATAVPGVSCCEQLPNVAKVLDRVTQIRSLHHEMKNHNPAAYYALTGSAPPLDDIRLRDTPELFPTYGSLVDALSPVNKDLPTFVALPHVIRDGAITPGQHASFLGKKHDPLLVREDPNSDSFKLPELSLPEGLSLERLENRREIQKLIERQTRTQEFSAQARGAGEYYERAIALLHSPKVREAFNIAAESKATRDRYGRTTYGQSCLLARRLVESGVKFVTVYFSDSIGGQSTTSGGWDTHGFNNTRMYPILQKHHLPLTDVTLPALLGDLDERGLLDETLVVWMGEFGRTPKINDNISRDHWPQCYTVLLAGGGAKRGFVYGASDKNGAYPDRDGVRPEDLSATMFQLLGIDPATEVRDFAGRPLPIAAGKTIHGIIA